jgi:hypothetical protein
MAAKLKDKRISITTVRDQCQSFATFPSHLIFHWSLPLISVLCVYEYAKQQKKPEKLTDSSILDQNQNILKSLFFTPDKFE